MRSASTLGLQFSIASILLFGLEACAGSIAPEPRDGTSSASTASGAAHAGLEAGLPHTSCRADGACMLVARAGSASVQNPAFSPDGATLLFTRFHAAYNDGPADLVLLPLAAGAQERILVANDGDNVNLPGSCWSRSGLITYSSDHAGPDGPWTVQADGTHAKQVPLGLTHQAFEPSFSPDATQITYEDVLTEAKHSIFVAGVDGTGKKQITQGPDDRQPNWSPRGDLIIFQRRVSAVGQEERWALFLMKPDGSSVKRVSPTNQDATDASFSSDGARIVYSAATDDEDGASLWIAGADGTNPKRLTHSAPYDGAPSFTPDGRTVAFETTQGADESPTDLMWIAVPAP